MRPVASSNPPSAPPTSAKGGPAVRGQARAAEVHALKAQGLSPSRAGWREAAASPAVEVSFSAEATAALEAEATAATEATSPTVEAVAQPVDEASTPIEPGISEPAIEAATPESVAVPSSGVDATTAATTEGILAAITAEPVLPG